MQPYVTCHIGSQPPLLKRRPPLGLQSPRPVQPHVKPLPTPGLLFLHPVQPHYLPPSPKHMLPFPARGPHPPWTPTYPGMMWAPGPFTATPGTTRISSLTHGRQTRSERGSTLTPPPSLRATLPLPALNLSKRMPRPPQQALPKARRKRAPLQPPKSCQPATVCLPLSHRSRSPHPKEDSTPLILFPPSTNKRP